MGPAGCRTPDLPTIGSVNIEKHVDKPLYIWYNVAWRRTRTAISIRCRAVFLLYNIEGTPHVCVSRQTGRRQDSPGRYGPDGGRQPPP